MLKPLFKFSQQGAHISIMKKHEEKYCSFLSDTMFTYPALAVRSIDGNYPGTTKYEDKFVPTKGKLQIKPQVREITLQTLTF